MDDQLDPLQKVELAMVRAEHQKRFQVMIDYLKARVGEGVEYRNAVVRVVVSEDGAYYELNDLPEEFSGAVGEHVERHFVAPQEAIALLARAVASTARVHPETTRRLSMLALYTRRGVVDRKNCYVYDYRADADTPPLEIGRFQPDVMPLFYKIRWDADFGPDILDTRQALVFCMANAGDRHLLIRIPLQDESVVDLGAVPASDTIQ